MRYAAFLAGIALLGWAQTPAPLDRWALYAKAGDSLIGPLPQLALIPGNWQTGYFYLPVYAILHDQRGIDRWRWEVWRKEWWSSRPYMVSTAETLWIDRYTLYRPSEGVEVRLWLFAGGDSVASSRVIFPTQSKVTTSAMGGAFIACAGGLARIVVQDMHQDVARVQVSVEQNGQVYASTYLDRPGFWDFPAPPPGTYEVILRPVVRSSVPFEYPPDRSSRLVVLDPQAPGRERPYSFLAAPACPGEPVSLALSWKEALSPLPTEPPRWDLDGDARPDAQGWTLQTSFPTPGSYPVYVQLSLPGGCELKDTFHVQVEDPTPPSMSVGMRGTYTLGTPVTLQVTRWKGLLSCDMEDDGSWEGKGILPPLTPTGRPQLPPYTFRTAPPSSQGYPIRLRQEICGRVYDTVLYWKPDSVAPPMPQGTLELDRPPRCAGDRIHLRLESLTNFSPGEPGYWLNWQLNGQWLGYTTRTETTLTWTGTPFSVACLLITPSGRSKLVGPLSVTPSAGSHLWFYPVKACNADWCPDWDVALCSGTRIALVLPEKDQHPTGVWRLVLPDQTVEWPLSEAPDTFYYTLPPGQDAYLIESYLILPCGTFRSVETIRTPGGYAGRPAAYSAEAGCTPHQRLTVCPHENVPLFWDYPVENGAGGLEGVRWLYADGSPAEVLLHGPWNFPQLLAPGQPGTYLLYQIWENCEGRQDTQRLTLVVREGEGAYFTLPEEACIGSPVEVRRLSPTAFRGPVAGLKWEWGDGQLTFDTTRVLTHLYERPGTYRVTLTTASGGCSGSLSRIVRVLEGPPRLKDPLLRPQGLTLHFETGLTGEGQVVWDFGDGTTQSGLQGTHTYRQPGIYTVRLRATNSCGEDLLAREVQVWNERDQGPWRAFPNPASQTIWVEVPLQDEGTCTLLTPDGREALTFPVRPGLNPLALPPLPNGLYLVRCQGKNYTGTLRLQIVHP
ncbi:MAG: hypothetical protein KatS3mg026_0593 [Bacteroidia bacterium]|nr:MAG: hypothetical protein KatS3mg026_0593 [Bacteroidia bacterium]